MESVKKFIMNQVNNIIVIFPINLVKRNKILLINRIIFVLIMILKIIPINYLQDLLLFLLIINRNKKVTLVIAIK